MVDDPNKLPPSSNFFVRFRHSVDSTVRRGIDTVAHRQLKSKDSQQPRVTLEAAYIRPNPKRAHLVDLDPPTHEIASSPSSCFTMSSVPSSDSASPSPAEDFDTFTDPESWARHSPYSPFNLQHLPQPIPRDISQTQGHNDFTFRDAFEDLMTVSSGRPLPRGTDLLATKLHVDFMFANGMPVSNWVRMLSVRGLWSPYFSQHQKLQLWEQGSLGGEIASMLLDWGLDGGWLAGITKPHDQSRTQRFPPSLGNKEATSQRDSDRGHPDTEEEFYNNSRQSDLNEEPRYVSPWELMVEALSENRNVPKRRQVTSPTDMSRTNPASNETEPKEAEETESRKTWDGGRVDTTRKRREQDGRVEITETQLRYDSDGNLVGRSESTNLKTSTSASGSESEQDFSGSTSSSSSSQWSRTWKWGQDSAKTWNRDENGRKHGEHGGFGADDDVSADGKAKGWFWTK